MTLEFARPWLLLLLPVTWALVWGVNRHYRRGRRTLAKAVALWMRQVLCALIGLALSMPSMVLPSSRAAAWVVLDASDSVSSLRAEVDERVSRAFAFLPEDVSAGVMAFGSRPGVELPLGEAREYRGLQGLVGADASRLSEALALAGSLLPDDSAARIVVVSDGKTDGITQQAAALRDRGIPVDVRILKPEAGVDAQVTDVKLPAGVYQGMSFSVEVTIDARSAMQGTLVLYQNREPVATREVTLRRGENSFTFRDVAKATGIVTYEAHIMAEGDSQPENDRLGGYLSVSGSPKVLLVEGTLGEGSEMAKFLGAAGMETETILPAGMPHSPEGYLGYDGICLVNVEYDLAGDDAWMALDSAVRGFGRGLAVIGGDSSYALGGYRGTPLEGMLPVTVDVRNRADLPDLALVLVIDKSGSMSDGMYGTTRLELAKEAAMRACEVLSPRDQVGVIAFDDMAKWVLPLALAEDVPAIQAAIGTIRPGGGTAFFSALYEANRALLMADAKKKHVIFLTDGQSGDRGYEGLVTEMAANGISVTTVAVGDGADGALLRRLAEMGDGRSYAAGEFDNLPKIFTKETYLVSGAYVQNRVFTPIIVEEGPLTDFSGFPPLTGYLATTEKAAAHVVLVSDREDPIVSWWQYGMGRVLSFTSDSRGAWTDAFLAWEEATAFFAGLVAQVLPEKREGGEVTVDARGEMARVTYMAPAGEEPVTGLATQMTVVYPSGKVETVPLTETAFGVYEGTLPAGERGAYAVRVEQTQDGTPLRVTEGGVVLGYSAEYDLRREDGEAVLRALAQTTGGSVLEEEEDLLAHVGGSSYVRRDLTGILLWVLFGLLLLDIALRRLPWERRVLAAWEKLRNPERHGKSQDRESRATKEAEAQTRTPKSVPKPMRAEAAKPSDTADQLLAIRNRRKKL